MFPDLFSKNKKKNKQTKSNHLPCCISWFPIKMEDFTIFTVLQSVLRYPLAGIMSSLSSHTGHIITLIKKVDLKPLTGIVITS